ncbi:hypothetical protein [Xanthomonas medicagonis]|uniref:hypothetical protein n=1 Tax=Xanthomonas medicagonis TaxID=3160841 RepID=UPI00351501E1
MRFSIELTSSWTVKYAERIESGWVFDMSKGACWLRLRRIEALINAAMSPLHFGNAIDMYVLGFEIADSQEGFTFEETRGYVSYRPKSKRLISVAQMDWPEIRSISPMAQLELFNQSVLGSIDRAASARRKPRDFDFAAFRLAMRQALQSLDPRACLVALDEERYPSAPASPDSAN